MRGLAESRGGAAPAKGCGAPALRHRRLVGAGLVGVLAVLLLWTGLQELRSRAAWGRCSGAAGRPWVEVTDELRRGVWPARVECRPDRGCRWRTWLNPWACSIIREGESTRSGGSG